MYLKSIKLAAFLLWSMVAAQAAVVNVGVLYYAEDNPLALQNTVSVLNYSGQGNGMGCAEFDPMFDACTPLNFTGSLTMTFTIAGGSPFQVVQNFNLAGPGDLPNPYIYPVDPVNFGVLQSVQLVGSVNTPLVTVFGGGQVSTTGTLLAATLLPNPLDPQTWNGVISLTSAAPNAVPEPGTAVLALLGIAGLISLRRR